MTDPGLHPRVYRSQAHLDASLEAARQSMTLLKNGPSVASFKDRSLHCRHRTQCRCGAIRGLREIVERVHISMLQGFARWFRRES